MTVKKTHLGSASPGDAIPDDMIKAAIGKVMESELPEGPPPGSRTRDYRFGIGMLILAVLTAVFGAYPLDMSVSWRVMFLPFALVLAVIGAYFLDRSSRSTIRPPPKARQSPEVGRGPRRVK